MELEALFDAVIVKPQEEEETQYGSIVVPDLGKDRNEHGTVVAVGPGRQVAGIGFVETNIKVGDKIESDVTPIAYPIKELPNRPKQSISDEFTGYKMLGLLPKD